ncbi:Choline/ethanolaminephosphotransferase 1 [Paragonimus heterotremus]|uniref:Choline/ethanolaminephosphotransferase 1 n=1 Tax=Paragonimus heterotremus TaxID=100268 RepID=A0A8J4T925_9TREM|nr:Choline/ethanolaminephosphotransferase 1 [Paragonimus heterotremus]
MCGLLSADVLDEDQVIRIVEHKYKVYGKSFCEPLLEGFWKWSVRYIPKQIAPNALTLAGLLTIVLPAGVLLYCSPYFRDEISPVCILLFALGVFIYQTLDALDGLHARQTNTCSQLGELFDHGCDAISMYFASLGYFSIIGLGRNPTVMFVEFFIFGCVFYFSQWQSYVTGVMCFDGFSVTEAILVCILSCIVSALFGVSIWQTKDPIFGLEINQIQFIIVILGSVVLFSRFGHTISVGGSGKFGTTVANTSVLFPICPLLLVLGSAVLLATRSPSDIYHNHPCLFLLGFGAVMAKVSQNLVIAHMTKSSIALFDSVMLGPFSLLVNLYFECPISERFLLWLFVLWSTLDMLYFCIRVAIQVAKFLNLYIFRVDRPAMTATGMRRPRLTTRSGPSSGTRSSSDSPSASLRTRTRRLAQ